MVNEDGRRLRIASYDIMILWGNRRKIWNIRERIYMNQFVTWRGGVELKSFQTQFSPKENRLITDFWKPIIPRNRR